MGWLFNWDTRKELITHLTKDHETLRHCHRGNILWALLRSTPPEGEQKRFIACYLLKRDCYGMWGYKGMDESMGPFYYTCPLSYIKDASPPVNEAAANWRAQVKIHHKYLRKSNKRRK
jgi:hypothetical protein